MNKLAGYNKEGPGVSKDNKDNAFIRFFKVYKDKFWKLMGVSVIYSICLILVLALCFIPYKFIFTSNNPLIEYMEQQDFSAEYVQFAERYLFISDHSKDELQQIKASVAELAATVKQIDPLILTEGTTHFDSSKLTAEQSSALQQGIDELLSVMGLNIINDSEGGYSVSDENGNVMLSCRLTSTKAHVTYSVPRMFDMNNLVKTLACLFPLILLGPIHAGLLRITRDFVRGEPVFMLSDMWDTIKKNWAHSLLITAVQYVGTFVLAIAWFYYNSLSDDSIMTSLGVGATLLAILTFISMQFYVMLMQITLDLKLGKIFKNAALFSVISLFRNILMMVIIAVLLAGTFLLYIVGMSSASFTIIAALMLLAWVFIIFGFIFYMNSAIAYPAIQQYVIDPYYSENQAETSIGITAADVTEDAASRVEGEDEDELPEYVYHNGRMVHRSVFENDNIFND